MNFVHNLTKRTYRLLSKETLITICNW